MYEDLIKDLRNCFGTDSMFCDCDSCHYKGLVDDHDYSKCVETLGVEAADAIERLQKPQWIPVTERLPECEWGAEVGNIEWISCGMVFAGCFGRGGKYRDAYFRTWTDGTEGIDAKDADYWRQIQIPEPPKEDDNG